MGGQFAQGLRHQASLLAWHEAPMSPSISSLGVSAATESMTITSIAGADERVDDFERLLAGVGLGNEQFVQFHADLAGIVRIHGMLCIEEGANAALLLSFGDDVESQRGLAG